MKTHPKGHLLGLIRLLAKLEMKHLVFNLKKIASQFLKTKHYSLSL